MNYDKLFITTTDTVTGIAAPMTKEGLDALYFIKNRPLDKQIAVMVGSLEQAKKLKGWTPKATKMADLYWPGATTLVLNEKMAVRLPDSTSLKNLLLQKGPVYMTSANMSGEKNLSFKEAKEKFYEVKEHYDFGKGSGKESSVIRVEDGEVLR